MININEPSETILGYFTVASVSQKRIFVDKIPADFYYPTCLVLTDSRAISDFKRNHGPPYFWVDAGENFPGLLTWNGCVDCRNDGGELDKPDFWIEQ